MAHETQNGQEVTKSLLQREWLIIVLVTLPFLLIAVYWSSLPETIPMHWNADGVINGYGPRSSIFILPFVNIGLALLLYYIPRIDPKKANYAFFQRGYHIIRLALAAFMSGLFVVTIMASLGMKIDMNRIVLPGMSLLFLVFGNVMRTFRQNYFAGIRTPWTLSDPVVWDKTHKLAGWIWTSGALVLFIASSVFIPDKDFFKAYIFAFIAMGLIPVVASYFYYRQLHPKE